MVKGANFTPTKGGGAKCFSHGEGGGGQGFRIVQTQELDVSAILKGTHKVPTLYKWLEGGST